MDRPGGIDDLSSAVPSPARRCAGCDLSPFIPLKQGQSVRVFFNMLTAALSSYLRIKLPFISLRPSGTEVRNPALKETTFLSHRKSIANHHIKETLSRHFPAAPEHLHEPMPEMRQILAASCCLVFQIRISSTAAQRSHTPHLARRRLL